MRTAGALADCAILYRSNAQSRLQEEALLHMPRCRTVFTAASALRAPGNQRCAGVSAPGFQTVSDDAAFERVVNTLTRGDRRPHPGRGASGRP